MRYALLASVLFCVSAVHAQIRLPAVFGDNMVLQQNAEVAIWGWGPTGGTVTISPSWGDASTKAICANTGKWNAVIRTAAAGGPHSVRITAGGTERTLNNVMLGEVWICSGQSNMEWSVNNGVADAREEMPNANFPNIRLFQVSRFASDYPQERGDGTWVACTPQSMKSFSSVGYFFGKRLHLDLNIPIGMINVSWGGTSAEVWQPDSLITANRLLVESSTKTEVSAEWPRKPGVVYNGMIHPLIPFRMAGVIWYQGEGNRFGPENYKLVMESMINSWRRAFQRDFPFYYVQIAPFKGNDREPLVSLLREQQVEMMTIPNTGMVVIDDQVDDVKDIHPKYKRQVGERLAAWALSERYGKTGIAYRPPVYKSMKVEKARIRLEFDNCPNGLIARGPDLLEFQIAGSDRKFYPAKARIEGKTVVVSAKEVKEPVAVRYSWGNGSIGNLFSKEGLPVALFRTDRWNP